MKDYTPFANRLRKMTKHYGKWARRKEIEVYRIYDADLDEFPILVDRYAGQVYVSPSTPASTPTTAIPE